MPADLESRLAAARPTAAEPPAVLLGALRQRRRARRAAALGTMLAVLAGIWVSLLPSSAPVNSRVVAAEPREFLPTIRALSAANPSMDADTLRLPAVRTTSVTTPITVRSFDEVGG